MTLVNELELFRRMLKIRYLEHRLQELCFKGEGSDLHFSKGQEAIAVGICSVLSPSDYSCTHHRTIAHAVARSVPLPALVCEVLGKSGPIAQGKAGEMHLSYPALHYMFSFQLVATPIPVSAGIAWASKYVKKEDSITACFFGDAAGGNSQFHEGLNIACVNKVPLLMVCENNHLAGNIRPDRYQPDGIIQVRQRVTNYCDSAWCDGNKIDEVISNAKLAIDQVRKTSRPFFLECDTTRLSVHKQGQGDARPKSEIEELVKRDPIAYWADKHVNLVDQADIYLEVKKEVDSAIEFARRQPFPTIA